MYQWNRKKVAQDFGSVKKLGRQLGLKQSLIGTISKRKTLSFRSIDVKNSVNKLITMGYLYYKDEDNIQKGFDYLEILKHNTALIDYFLAGKHEVSAIDTLRVVSSFISRLHYNLRKESKPYLKFFVNYLQIAKTTTTQPYFADEANSVQALWRGILEDMKAKNA